MNSNANYQNNLQLNPNHIIILSQTHNVQNQVSSRDQSSDRVHNQFQMYGRNQVRGAGLNGENSQEINAQLLSSHRDVSEGAQPISQKRNAALKFRRQYVHQTNGERNGQQIEQNNLIDSQRFHNQTISPRIATNGFQNHTFIQQQQNQINNQNLHLPSTFEISSQPLTSVRNMTLQKTPVHNKVLPNQITPKNIQIINNNGGGKSNLQLSNQNKTLMLNQTITHDGELYINQTINNTLQITPQHAQSSFNNTANQNTIGNNFNRHSRVQMQAQQQQNIHQGSPSPISARSSHRNTANNKGKAQAARNKAYILAESDNIHQFNTNIGITPKQQQIINMTTLGWNTKPVNQTLDQTTILSNRKIQPSIKDVFTNLAANLNTHRGSNYDRKPQKNIQLQISNDLVIPSIGQTQILTPKKTIDTNKSSIQNQQFPPVIFQQDTADTQLIQNILKARDGNGKRTTNNKTTQENLQNVQMLKTIDMVAVSNGPLKLPTDQRNGRSGSSFNNSKDVTALSNLQRKYVTTKDEQSSRKGFPMSPDDILKIYGNHLTSLEKEEVKQYEVIYYLTLNKRRSGMQALQVQEQDEESQQIFNNGYDNDQGDYLFEMNDHLNYRYEILKRLGKGAFGIVLQCFDHKLKEKIALKILKNKKKLHKQGKIEIKILELLRDNDLQDSKNIVTIKDSFTFRNHICISFELLSLNLYQFIKNNEFQGFSLALTKRFTIQMLVALSYLYKYSIVHCDLKPENVLLKYPNKSQIKLIDFGSSCFEKERYYTYIQSRFYRAPEIMLGIPYTPAIDMWSLGCIVYECLVGIPIYAGENEKDQMGAIMEVTGLPPRSLIAKATRRKVFFDDDYNPIIKPNSRGKLRKPGCKPLSQHQKLNDPDLVEFLNGCFEWKPEKRLKPDEALQMPWIQKAISESRFKKQQRQQDSQLQQDSTQSTTIPAIPHISKPSVAAATIKNSLNTSHQISIKDNAGALQSLDENIEI